MGNCCGIRVEKGEAQAKLYKIQSKLTEQEINILHLIYKDLADRITDRKMDLQNFLLFFHKNGYWGERLFREFDLNESSMIEEQQFIGGIAKIFKSTEQEKISLLFKFFSRGKNSSDGVFFADFLIMLYNYPKQDLKEILNDKDFIEFELKKHLVPADLKRSQSLEAALTSQNLGHLKRRISMAVNYLQEQKPVNSDKQIYKMDEQVGDSCAPSMIGKDVIKHLRHRQTLISLSDGQNVYDIKTINIQQIVKKFAHRIFRQANIDYKTGRLNYNQFREWISNHKALFQNYYEGFHNLVWQYDHITQSPKFITTQSEKISPAKTYFQEKMVMVLIYLQHSILIVCQENDQQHPLQVICLEGLAVSKVYEPMNGFGILISHRNGLYSQKKFFFKNERLYIQWMDLLRFFKGESVQQKYEIGTKIGAGKFSVVYKCRNIIQNKQYALKQIATFKLDQDARHLIAHESSIMQVISHPLLLQFKQVIQTKTHIYIVTQLVNGRDLFEVVKQHEYLDEYDAARVTQQVIIGIMFLHSLQIVHRDLKPENIMVQISKYTNQPTNIKVIDFGFSNYLSKLLQKNKDELLSGTPNYIAPEVLREEEISFKIDNFAIGVIIYFMLTGTLPFNDVTIADILKNTLMGVYDYPEHISVSKQAKNLIDQLMKNDPKQRMQLQDALKHPWFEILKQPRRYKQRASTRIIINANNFQ